MLKGFFLILQPSLPFQVIKKEFIYPSNMEESDFFFLLSYIGDIQAEVENVCFLSHPIVKARLASGYCVCEPPKHFK